MKTRIKNSVRFFAFALVLSLSFILGCSCTKSKPEPDPLAGWNAAHVNPDRAINNDYHDYIKKLPPEQNGYIGSVFFFEDGTGQHAVSIEIFEGNKNASWQHVLIYDKADKRIKIIRYGYRKYQS